jgi:hypothetical protein
VGQACSFGIADDVNADDQLAEMRVGGQDPEVCQVADVARSKAGGVDPNHRPEHLLKSGQMFAVFLVKCFSW